MLVVHLKSFGCKRLKLAESFWHGPCASLLFLYDHCSLFFGFCVFLLSLGVALHYIHAFYSRCFFFFSIYKKKKKIKRRKKGRKKEAHCVLALFSLFLKTRLVNLFSHDMSIVLCLALTSLFIALY